MKYARLTMALLSLPLFAGCSLAPVYKVPEMPMPAAYKEAGIWQPANPSDNLDRGDWWKNYDDNTIDKLIGQLDAANPTLAAAVAHYDQAAAYEQQARASLYPTVSVGGAATDMLRFADRPSHRRLNPSHRDDAGTAMAATADMPLTRMKGFTNHIDLTN